MNESLNPPPLQASELDVSAWPTWKLLLMLVLLPITLPVQLLFPSEKSLARRVFRQLHVRKK